MKFLHTSDLHIGKTVCGFSMLEEQIHSLKQIADTAADNQVDAVFLCGNLYALGGESNHCKKNKSWK